MGLGIPWSLLSLHAVGYRMGKMATQELAEALTTMTVENVNYRSNPDKKDFSNWLGDIIGDDRLAKDLEKAISRPQVANQAKSRLGVLRKKLPQ